MKHLILLFSTVIFAQSNIVASGHDNYTVGSQLVELQIPAPKKDPVLSVPKYEIPIEQPKPIVEKKKSLWQKIIEAFKKVFKSV